MSTLIKKLVRNLTWIEKNVRCKEIISFYFTDETKGGWENEWRWKDITQHLRHGTIVWHFNPPLLENDAITYIRNTPPNTKSDGHTSESSGIIETWDEARSRIPRFPDGGIICTEPKGSRDKEPRDNKQ